MKSETVPPPVTWAQRNDLLYITIDVECKDIDYKVTENTFQFKGVNVLDNKKYEVTLNLLHPVNPERVTSKNIGRCLEFTIYKSESGPFWPSLTTDKTKLHFLKANFSKWINESDDEDENAAMGGGDFDKFMNMSPDWNNKFDDFNPDDDDSDDDNIPSLAANDDDDENETEKDKEEGDKQPQEEKK